MPFGTGFPGSWSVEEFKEQRGRLLGERRVVEERQPLSPGLPTCTVLGGSGLSYQFTGAGGYWSNRVITCYL